MSKGHAVLGKKPAMRRDFLPPIQKPSDVLYVTGLEKVKYGSM
jgi:hypothetical protein